jgi:hypothetical protein
MAETLAHRTDYLYLCVCLGSLALGFMLGGEAKAFPFYLGDGISTHGSGRG